jgi:Spy/CpxP family protein refolding chaperone
MLVRRIARLAFAPLLIVAAGALFLGGCRGRACGWHGSVESRADHVVKRIAKELDLNAQQKAGLEKIKADMLARRGDFMAMHGGFKEELAAQLRAGSVDKAKLNQSMAAREAKEQEIRAFLIDELAEFHAMLEPSQREKLAAKLESHCR